MQEYKKLQGIEKELQIVKDFHLEWRVFSV